MSNEDTQALVYRTLLKDKTIELLEKLEKLRHIQTKTQNGDVNGFSQKNVSLLLPGRSWWAIRRKINRLVNAGILERNCIAGKGSTDDIFTVKISPEKVDEIRKKAIRLIDAKLGEKQKWQRSTKHERWMYEKGEFGR